MYVCQTNCRKKLHNVELIDIFEGEDMIRCNLSRILGEKKMKVSDVERATKLHRHKITALYKETAIKVDLETIDKICEFLECTVGELFERIDSDTL